MPRVVIYGPMSLGGQEIMDLRIEQVACQWETTQGYLCQEDRARVGLQLTLNDHQCIIGSDTLVLNLNPEKYDYGVKNSQWKYQWKSLWESRLSAEFYNAWLPRRNRTDDINLMDRAIAILDSILTDSKWPLLEHINRCRLYLDVIYISELSKDE